jgi:hypothetical protein
MESLTRIFVAFLAAVWAAAGVSACAAPPPLGLTLPCQVVRVHDGDSANEVEITIRCQVRYLDCWSPELSEPGGKDAAASAKQAEGRHGRLHIPLSEAKNLADLFTFGRVVGEIWLDGEEVSESERQVRTKHASTIKGGRLGR